VCFEWFAGTLITFTTTLTIVHRIGFFNQVLVNFFTFRRRPLFGQIRFLPGRETAQRLLWARGPGVENFTWQSSPRFLESAETRKESPGTSLPVDGPDGWEKLHLGEVHPSPPKLLLTSCSAGQRSSGYDRVASVVLSQRRSVDGAGHPFS